MVLDYQLLYWSLITFLTPLVIAIVPIFKIKISEKVLHMMLGLSAGILGGLTFIDILPEAFEMAKNINVSDLHVSLGVASGFFLLFLIEKYLLTLEEPHGGHFYIESEKSYGILGIFALVIHGLIDGLIIPIAFYANTTIGLIVALGIVFHQIPDTFAALSISIASTTNIKKRLTYIISSALDTPLGIILGSLLTGLGNVIIPFGLGISAGTFIYVSAVDLIPELQHRARSMLVVLSMVVGFTLILILSLISF
jgi:zinc transporter ZupT